MIFSVSTVKDSRAHVQRFVRRNLAGGVDHLVVFLDDDQPEVQELLDAHPHVTCVRAGRDWWHGERPARLNARQRFNATAVVGAVASLPWVDWVFHIDGDEVVQLDRGVLDRLDPEWRAVRLRPLEAVALPCEADDPTWFKTLLNRDQLTLLASLGVIPLASNRSYFRGHVAGKIGVRPAPGLRLGIHRGCDRDGVRLPVYDDPALRLLHYESTGSEEFVRKWLALLESGPRVRQRPERSSAGRSLAALLEQHLSPEEARPFLERLYLNLGADDVETLSALRLLERVSPDDVSRTPEPFPPGGRERWADAVARLRATARSPFGHGERAGTGGAEGSRLSVPRAG